MRRTVAALIVLLLPAVAAAQPPSPTFIMLHVTGAASLLGGGTLAGTFTGGTFTGGTFTGGTFTGGTFTGGTLGGSITGTGATITGGTFNGITLSAPTGIQASNVSGLGALATAAVSNLSVLYAEANAVKADGYTALDGTIAGASSTLSASRACTLADVGKVVTVAGAGPIDSTTSTTSLTIPAFASVSVTGSPFTWTNPSNQASLFNVSGGTVSQVSLNGVAQSTTSGIFVVPGSGTATVTYSVIPTVTAEILVNTFTLTVASPSLQAFAYGEPVVIADSGAATTNYLVGTVVSYNSSTGSLVALIPQSGVHGSGTKTSWNVSGPGTPDALATTVTACSGSNYTLATAASTAASAASWAIGTDNSATLSSLIASNPQAKISLPAGLILLSGTQSILNDIHLIGAGIGPNTAPSGAPIRTNGTMLVLTNRAVSPFLLEVGATVDDLSLYYPAQQPVGVAITPSGSPFTWTNTWAQPAIIKVSGGTVSAVSVGSIVQGSATAGSFPVPIGGTITITYTVAPSVSLFGPTAFPPTFAVSPSVGASQDVIRNVTSVNAYNLWQVDNVTRASGAGRVFWVNDHLYCVESCLTMTEGAADIISYDADTEVSVGFDPALVNGPLDAWTNNFGAFASVDIGPSAHNLFSALEMNAHMVHDYGYGLLIQSGHVSANLTTHWWDSVLTPLAILAGPTCSTLNTDWASCGSGQLGLTTGAAGWVYSHYNNSPADAEVANAINICTFSGDSNIEIAASQFIFTLGNFYSECQSQYNHLKLNVSGTIFQNWGQSTAVAGATYSALNISTLSSSYTSITGSHLSAEVRVGTNTDIGIIFTRTLGTALVEADTFFKGSFSIQDAASDAGTLRVQGNISNSVGTSDMRVTGTNVPTDINNQWSKPIPSLTGSGNIKFISHQPQSPASTTVFGTCAAATEGAEFPVTNATAPTYLGALVLAGAVHTMAYCDGTTWLTR